MSVTRRLAAILAARCGGIFAANGGHRPGGESHFRVEVIADGFAGQSRIDRQRRVCGILAEELKAGVHALALTTLTPAEDQARRAAPLL